MPTGMWRPGEGAGGGAWKGAAADLLQAAACQRLQVKSGAAESLV